MTKWDLTHVQITSAKKNTHGQMMVQHVQTRSAKRIPNNNSKYMKREKNFGGDGCDYGID